MEIKINININDRIVNFAKKMFSGKRLIISATVLTLATGIILYAAPAALKVFNAGDIISAADVNANFAALKSQIDAVEANSNGAPVGTIIAYGGTTLKPDGTSNIPAGWLLCDGKTYSRSTYDKLFNVIYDNWGAGNGVTTFNVPDLRGVFLRGSNLVTGTADRTDGYNDAEFSGRSFLLNPVSQDSDNSEKIGSFQLDAFQGHWHNVSNHGINTALGVINAGVGTNHFSAAGITATNPISDGTNGTPRTSSESRSKNAAVHYIIKY